MTSPSMPRLVRVREILTCVVLAFLIVILTVWTIVAFMLGAALSSWDTEPAEPAQIEEPYFPPGTGGDVPE